MQQNELIAIGALPRRSFSYRRNRSLSAEDVFANENRLHAHFPNESLQQVVEMETILQPRSRTLRAMNKKTKIVCAIGPSCSSVDMLGKMIDAGMNVARLNFSHGDHDLHLHNLKQLRLAVNDRPNCHVAVLLDTKGPEIRTGMLENGKPIELFAGQDLEIGVDYDVLGNNSRIACSYEHLMESVDVGSIILCADGEIVLKVVEIHQTFVTTKVVNHCILEERKNMSLPGASIKIPGITDKDIQDIQGFALVHHVDIVSGSFVRSAENVRAIRNCLGKEGQHIRVHAKIESIEALRNIDEIIQAADGIHVSRGDLGMELEPQQVFLAQKMIIRKANLAGKPVVTSTQMLQSMTTHSVPTFAECSDVANAVIDGTDCIMLSAETAKGLYPQESVETMSRICLEGEQCLNYHSIYRAIRRETRKPMPTLEAIAASAVETSIDIKAKLIIAFSDTGKSAKFVAKYRPNAKIIVVTASPCVARQMNGVSRGVLSLLVSSLASNDAVLVQAINFAKKNLWISNSDMIVAIHGEQISLESNIVRVIEICPTGYTSPKSIIQM